MKIISEISPLDGQAILPEETNFPSARYFQIHFEYLHETIAELRQQVEQANRQIGELQRRLPNGVQLAEAVTEDGD